MNGTNPACPICGKRNLIRVHRRRLDRLFCVFVKVHRYRCQEYPCTWEGRLKVPEPARTSANGPG